MISVCFGAGRRNSYLLLFAVCSKWKLEAKRIIFSLKYELIRRGKLYLLINVLHVLFSVVRPSPPLKYANYNPSFPFHDDKLLCPVKVVRGSSADF